MIEPFFDFLTPPGFLIGTPMNRTVFLLSYISIALLFSGGLGSPWNLTLIALTFVVNGLGAVLTPQVLVSVLAPIALVVLARLRGKRVAAPKLFLLPVFALVLTISPVLVGLLTKLLQQPGKSQAFGPIAIYGSIVLGTASIMGPVVLHTVCCVLGGKRDQMQSTADGPRQAKT